MNHRFPAHRKLYVEAGVLHRDISVLNILLGGDNDDLDGFLVDIDMAIFHERPPGELSAQMRTVRCQLLSTSRRSTT